MTTLNEIYKCEVCGNIVEMVHAADGELVCCGKPMVLQAANTVDASKEKHVPVVEKNAQGTLIKIGTVAHPMEEKHYIEFIEVISGNKVYRAYLKPGDKPEAQFELEKVDFARAYCNLHGLWKS
jgi:superoxide reductase